MALSRRSFWEQFFEQRVTPPDPNVQSEAGEWYIGVEKSLTVCAKRLAARNRATTRILHNGCGSSELGVALSQRGSPYGFQLVMDGDFSAMVVQQMSKRFPRQTFLVIDAKAMPFEEASLDVIICKGMFDSITADASTRPDSAAAVVAEAARCLSSGGEYFIFSTFGPEDQDKDMRALLSHPDLDVEVEELPWPPLEIPDQPSSFLWALKRRPRS